MGELGQWETNYKMKMIYVCRFVRVESGGRDSSNCRAGGLRKVESKGDGVGVGV